MIVWTNELEKYFRSIFEYIIYSYLEKKTLNRKIYRIILENFDELGKCLEWVIARMLYLLTHVFIMCTGNKLT